MSKVSTCSKVLWSNVTLNWENCHRSVPRPEECVQWWLSHACLPINGHLPNVCTSTCTVSEMGSSETTAGCCYTTICPPTAHWMWRGFVLLNWSVWSSIPLITRFVTRRLLFPKVKMAVKGESFSNISDICGVTELQKGVSLQGFQHAFENLYKQSHHCVKLWGNYIKSLP
jgi:hypothetical protein